MDEVALKFVFLVLLAGSAILCPIVAGVALLIKARHISLGKMAGLLTLKAIITTPLWLAILRVMTMTRGPAPTLSSLWVSIVSVLPDVVLTLVAIAVFRRTLVGEHVAKAWTLIVLDSLRWGNNLLLALTTAAYQWAEPWATIRIGTVYFGLAIPTLFAVAATLLSHQAIVIEDAA